MRSHGRLCLFLFLVLVGFDGPAAGAAERGPGPSDPREAGTPVLLAAPAALPAGPRASSPDGMPDFDGAAAPLSATASVARRSPGGLHSRAAEWLSFRRPFADTVSYRTTAPPSRVA